MKTTVEEIKRKVAKMAALKTELTAKVDNAEKNLAELKAKAKSAAEEGRLEDYKAASAAIQDAEAALFVARAQLDKCSAGINEAEVKAAWSDYAADYNKKLDKMLSQFAEKRRDFLAAYREMIDLQADALKTREELGNYIELAVRIGENPFDRAFPCKTLPSGFSGVEIRPGELSVIGTPITDPDAVYYISQISKEKGKPIASIFNDPDIAYITAVIDRRRSK